MGVAFRYRYKQVFAIVFASLAFAFHIADFITTKIILKDQNAFSSPLQNGLMLFSFLIMALAFGWVLVGNIQSNGRAYAGLLLYVGMQIVGFIYDAVFGSIDFFRTFTMGEPTYVVLSVMVLLFYVACAASGIMLYLMVRRYIIRQSIGFGKVLLWAIIFGVMNLIAVGFWPLYVFLLSGNNPALLLHYFGSAAELCITLAIFFTVLRLKNDL